MLPPLGLALVSDFLYAIPLPFLVPLYLTRDQEEPSNFSLTSNRVACAACGA